MAQSLTVIFTESAIQDMEEIREYYQEQVVADVGEQFLQEIIALAEDLATRPNRGRIVPEFNQPRLRELIHPPFRIVYQRTVQQIAIVRIWRSERLLKLP
ncbi:MAG: type II toxin-antitoxin system RelE/ParE family toxin [Thermodesulfobacteriota bacterium]|nr:type II toxin-antitoxin system RelE/ParE family toxin [Thermodesulfobacteriota bacterium]